MEVNKHLDRVAELKGFENSKEKGNEGEKAAAEVVKDFMRKKGVRGVLYGSVIYPLVSNSKGEKLPANFTLENNTITPSALGTTGEIDILLLTDRKVFIIEVKTYNQFIIVDDEWTYKGGSPNSLEPIDFCNLQQVEKSARHFYHTYYDLIPDGDPNYIVPILVYAQGKLMVKTKDYNVCRLNNLKQVLVNNYKPLDYLIDVNKLIKAVGERSKSLKKL